MPDQPCPLDGIRVLDLTTTIAGPYCSRLLADMGAAVIKVEGPEGDMTRERPPLREGASTSYGQLNAGKRSIALDLKADPGDDRDSTIARLVARADVFVQNFAPGAAERLGLGAAELRERHPRLITCSISGYGPDGPYRDAKAYDLLIQSEAGLVSVTGTQDEPAKAGIPAADIGAAK